MLVVLIPFNSKKKPTPLQLTGVQHRPQPFLSSYLKAYEWEVRSFSQLKLPPQQIKGYFNRASAVALQKDDLLVLLDECLSLIAIQGNVNQQ